MRNFITRTTNRVKDVQTSSSVMKFILEHALLIRIRDNNIFHFIESLHHIDEFILVT